MSKELLLIAESVSNQKGVTKEVVIDAIRAALESAARKKSGMDINVRVALDMETGEYETFRVWEVVADEDVEIPEQQIAISEAQQKNAELEIGNTIEEPMESVEFGRIAAQTAKQVIVQKVREAERMLVVEQYQARLGELVTGIVKKITRDNVILDLGANAEALLPRTQTLPRELFRPGDKVRAYLYEVSNQLRGPQIFLSRTHPNMLIELFRIEVPEVGEEVIQIKAAARDPGVRAKIAVKTNDGRIDPIGACVGMRGSRVQAVSGELGGERVDIILWDDNPAQLVINALSPAEVSSIVVDEEKHMMDIAVAEDQLSLAIGRNGQNIRLASELTGWELNVMDEEAFKSKGQTESENAVKQLIEALDIDEEVAELLTQEGFNTIEEVAYVPEEELLNIDGFDEEIVAELRSRANNAILTKALKNEEKLLSHEPAADLLTMEGMDKHTAFLLASHGITTMEELAEQAVDDLLDIEGMNRERAAALIMKAREPWFAGEKE